MIKACCKASLLHRKSKWETPHPTPPPLLHKLSLDDETAKMQRRLINPHLPPSCKTVIHTCSPYCSCSPYYLWARRWNESWLHSITLLIPQIHKEHLKTFNVTYEVFSLLLLFFISQFLNVCLFNHCIVFY